MKLTTIYERELQELKDWDTVEHTRDVYGFEFIVTAGHGYLVVPISNPMFYIAKDIVQYGFKGKKAIYLEEDVEAGEFLTAIGAINRTSKE